MVSPHAGDLVDQRLQRAGVLRHVEDRKSEATDAQVNAPKASAMKTKRPKAALDAMPRAGIVRGARAGKSRHRLHQRQRQRETERELADLACHWPSFQRPERFSASTTSGGM